MSRLIVISNRVQPPKTGPGGNQGGLAVALLAALREQGGIWFGWSGETTEEFSGHINFQQGGGVTTATIDLEPQDVDEYYNGYANRTLWPLFHYRIDLTEFERDFGSGYRRVNQRFADTVRPLIEDDDLVWVHDYHLMPLGQELRDRGFRNRLGFFLHIPWPPARLLLSLPSHRKLVETLFAYDVVGFHTEDWLDSFRDYVTKQLGGTLGPNDTVTYEGRTIRAIAAPIGIETKEFEEAAAGNDARFARERMYMSSTGRSLIVGVDRLDYSKGLTERFLGYERFLQQNPERNGLVYMLQIAPPSREKVNTYQEIRANLDALSGRINGEYADIDWVPIRYVNKGFPRQTLAGIYRAARIGLVTPLRDGMNLVAKEYVAAQDPSDPGVLILSSFAGAAAQLKEAVLVNPYSAEELSDAIVKALEMPRAERIRRWEALIDNVRREDVFWWCDLFLAALRGDAGAEAAAREEERA
ncbi:alpha,alpha-trehalose-phosphate synthase (UDP-forming) [Sphingomonas carotinifaciens]|uniref:Trehalose-6-phosphate synthase n=1 Tax=Sphingomonas carotinifaciens TaxID=1166323 RepID=A0A1G7G2Q4_9SPHN|nr:trehalose-6-phosphate synthase [Sphingomonas carotinifaciens]MBB4086351.1 trehalose 6-phosphate synthase [Sphingomonas carotinifaciens]MWC42671.1 trehalose-6-phosphate synthase [Sphingomonas carotinifaciens]SDE82373.1 trehalose 6-phosphate synthase [Sphingomonas carotinifaciens]